MDFQTFQYYYELCRETLLQVSNMIVLTRNVMINMKSFFCLGAFEICGSHFFVKSLFPFRCVLCVTFKIFRLSLIEFAPMICLDAIFLRNSITVAFLKTLNAFLMLNICPRLLVICFVLVSYVYMKTIETLHSQQIRETQPSKPKIQ